MTSFYCVAAAAKTFASNIRASSAALGNEVDVDGPALLVERSAHTGFQRHGTISANGSSRFLRCADGWVSLTLARPSDFKLVPAVVEFDGPLSGDLDCGVDGELAWQSVRDWCSTQSAHAARARAELFGLSCAVPGESLTDQPAATTPLGFGKSRKRPLVVDLSALWAGPLCAHLLGKAGCEVVKVESTDRPDGARVGSPTFYALLHGGHDSVAVDFTSEPGRRSLQRLLARADVVITSSRPRALSQLGVEPSMMMRDHPIQLWLSVTSFGPTQPMRIGYGDDCAVAGGLFQSPTNAGSSSALPSYIGDAIADPLTGLAGAAAVLEALVTNQRAHIEISLAGTAAQATRTAATVGSCNESLRPQRRVRTGEAFESGHHNSRWLADG